MLSPAAHMRSHIVQKMDDRQRGFNLVEAAIVLGVVGLVIGGIWVAAASVAEGQRQNQTSSEIGQIVANVRRLYTGVSSPDLDLSDPTNSALWPNIFPSEMLMTAGQVSDQWGHNVRVYLSSSGGTSVSFTFMNVPKSSCVNLAPRIYSTFRASLKIGGAMAYILDDDDDPLDTPNAAATNCSENESISFKVNF